MIMASYIVKLGLQQLQSGSPLNLPMSQLVCRRRHGMCVQLYMMIMQTTLCKPAQIQVICIHLCLNCSYGRWSCCCSARSAIPYCCLDMQVQYALQLKATSLTMQRRIIAEASEYLRQFIQWRYVDHCKEADFGHAAVMMGGQYRLHIQVWITAVVDKASQVALMLCIQYKFDLPAGMLRSFNKWILKQEAHCQNLHVPFTCTMIQALCVAMTCSEQQEMMSV